MKKLYGIDYLKKRIGGTEPGQGNIAGKCLGK